MAYVDLYIPLPVYADGSQSNEGLSSSAVFTSFEALWSLPQTATVFMAELVALTRISDFLSALQALLQTYWLTAPRYHATRCRPLIVPLSTCLIYFPILRSLNICVFKDY